jgi:hypothetical protein
MLKGAAAGQCDLGIVETSIEASRPACNQDANVENILI